MKHVRPLWNWTLLLLLGASSYATVVAFGYSPLFFLPAPGEPTATCPWTWGLVFTALTAALFLLCLNGPQQRRAAFVAFGVAALLTGPGYLLNVARLAEFAPASSPWAVPHLPGLTWLCLGASAGLVGWWFFRSGPVLRRGPEPVLLLGGLLLVLLVVPWLANRGGIESLRFFLMLPTSAETVQNDKDALTRLLTQGFAGALADMVGFMVQWIGLATSALILGVMAFAGMAWRRRPVTDGVLAHPFPGHDDRGTVLLLAMGGMVFTGLSWPMGNLQSQLGELDGTIHRPPYAFHAGLWSVEILAGLVFLTGSWLVLRRIQAATEVRFGFTVTLLVLSAVFSILLVLGEEIIKVGGILALLLCVAQVVAFIQAKWRGAWTSSAFGSPSDTALSLAAQGSVLLAVLASGLISIAVELAYVSVMAIHYLIDWGSALKLPHGTAPTGEIVPFVAPGVASVTVVLGPVYFSACLFFGVVVVMLFSIIYGGCRGCGKLYRNRAGIKRFINTISPDIYSDRA